MVSTLYFSTRVITDRKNEDGRMKIPKKYIHQSGINKGRLNLRALQTGEDKGFYNYGDPHPFVDGLFYRGWNKRVHEEWFTKDRLNAMTSYCNKYNKSEAGKATRIRHRKTEKGRATYLKHETSEKGKARRARNSVKYREGETYKARISQYTKSKKFKDGQKKYRSSDKGKVANQNKSSRRRAIKKKASANLTFTEEQLIKQYYNHSVRLKNKLGIEFHVDHIVPLSRGGLHHPSNLQVVPARWNIRKHNRNTNLWLPNGL